MNNMRSYFRTHAGLAETISCFMIDVIGAKMIA